MYAFLIKMAVKLGIKVAVKVTTTALLLLILKRIVAKIVSAFRSFLNALVLFLRRIVCFVRLTVEEILSAILCSDLVSDEAKNFYHLKFNFGRFTAALVEGAGAIAIGYMVG
jgi:hypothetical protein